MLTRLDLTDRPATSGPAGLAGVLPRAAVDVEAATHLVRPTVEAVRRDGAAAVREATRRFDGVELTDLRVPAAALHRAAEELDPDVRAALDEAIRRIRLVHEAQVPDEVTVEVVPGGTVTRRHLPVGRVGLYVPGGLAPLPSSVLMNVIPAQVAGVGSIAVASPPRRDEGGRPDRTILAACALLGVEEVYAVGGAQAVAMLAYGVAGRGPGRPRHRAGQRVRDRGQAAAARRGRHRRRGRPERGHGRRRRDRRPGAGRRRPAQPGRARPDLGLGAGHRLGGAGRRGRRRAGAAGRRDQARRAGHRGAVRPAVRHRAGPRPGPGARGRRRVRRRAPGDPHRRPGRRGPPGPQRRLRVRRRAVAGLAGRLRGRFQPRAADRRQLPAHRRPVRGDVPARRQLRRVRRGGAARDRPTTSSPWPTPRTCPRTRTRS